MAADGDPQYYAAVTAEQPGWRYDLAILEGEAPGAWDLRGAQEMAGEEILRTAREAEDLAGR